MYVVIIKLVSDKKENILKTEKGEVMKNITILFCFIILISGCAFTPQQIELAPQLTVRNDNMGNGTSIYLTVLDERATQGLGRRGSGYGPAAEITTATSLTDVVRKKVSEGLIARGFVVTDDESVSNKLQVEIRTLEYTTSTGFWTGGVHIRGALKGEAETEGDSYEEMYRYEKEERVVVTPTAERNSKWINTALSETLNTMFQDEQLFKFLANL